MGRVLRTLTNAEQIRAVDTFAARMTGVHFKRNYVGHRIMTTASVMNVFNVLNVPFYGEPPVSGDWLDTAGTDNLPNPTPIGEPVASGPATNRLYGIGSGRNEILEAFEEGDPSVLWTREKQRAMEVSWASARALSNGIVNGLGGKQPDGIATQIEAAAEAAQTGQIFGLNKTDYAFLRNRFVQLTSRAGYVAPGSRLPALVLKIIELLASCSSGARTPTDLVTYKAVFETLRRCMLEIFTDYHLISDKDVVANVGISNFEIEGTRVAWDGYIPSNRIYALQLGPRLDADRRLGIQLAGETRDIDYEQNVDSTLIDIDSPAISMIRHPGIYGRRLQPRNLGARSAQIADWQLWTTNVAIFRPNEVGCIADDASGAKMETYQ